MFCGFKCLGQLLGGPNSRAFCYSKLSQNVNKTKDLLVIVFQPGFCSINFMLAQNEFTN
jgi:hypothetical protein